MADYRLSFIVDAKGGNAAAVLGKTGAALKDVGSSSTLATTGLGLFQGIIGKISLGGVIAGLGAFARSSVMASEALGVTNVRFNTFFREEAPAAREELARLSDEMGLGVGTLTAYAARYQDMFVPMQFARDEAAEMSLTLAELTSKLQLVYKMSGEQTMQGLVSSLIGSSEAALRFGVDIRDAALSTELMRMGIVGGTAAATEQEKVLARLNLLLAGTADAQAAAGEISERLTGQTLRLKEAWTDLQEVMGEGVLPTTTAVVNEMTGVVKTVTLLVSWKKQLNDAYAEHGQNVLNTAATYEEYAQEMIRARVLIDGFSTGSEEALQALLSNGEALGYTREELEAMAAGWGLLTKEQWHAALSAIAAARDYDEMAGAFKAAADAAYIAGGSFADLAVEAFNVGHGFDYQKTAATLLSEALKIASGSTQDLLTNQLVLMAVTAEWTEETKEANRELISQSILNADNAKRLAELNQALEDGVISFGEYAAIIADGVVTLAELDGALGRVTSRAGEANLAVQHLTNTINGIPISKRINIDVVVSGLQGAALTGITDPDEQEMLIRRQFGADGSQSEYANTQNFGGFRASGGSVFGGQSYLVGERGPELLHMPSGTSGNIIPNHQLGQVGGVTIQQVIVNIQGGQGGRRAAEEFVMALSEISREVVASGTVYTG